MALLPSHLRRRPLLRLLRLFRLLCTALSNRFEPRRLRLALRAKRRRPSPHRRGKMTWCRTPTPISLPICLKRSSPLLLSLMRA